VDTANGEGRKILAVWGILVLAGFAFVLWLNVPILRLADYVRSKDYNTYLAAADRAMKVDDITTALQEVDRALELAPPNAHLPYKVKGDIYCHFKKWEEAVAAYEKAMELGSPNEGVRLNAVWALVSLERYREAVALGQKAEREGVTHPGLIRSIAEAHRRAGNYEAAIPYYERAVEAYPEDLYLMDQLRQAYARVKNDVGVATMQARIMRVQADMEAQQGETP